MPDRTLAVRYVLPGKPNCLGKVRACLDYKVVPMFAYRGHDLSRKWKMCFLLIPKCVKSFDGFFRRGDGEA